MQPPLILRQNLLLYIIQHALPFIKTLLPPYIQTLFALRTLHTLYRTHGVHLDIPP